MTSPGKRSDDPGHRLHTSDARPPAHTHNAHNLETVTVYYRWHPLFGLSLPVCGRSKHRDGERIYCKSPDGRICFLPSWMLRPECSQFSSGSPLVSLGALVELHDLLAAWQPPGPCDKAYLTPSRKEGVNEAICEATRPADESAAAQSTTSHDSSRRQARGTDPCTDGAADQRGPGKRRAGIQGRKK